ncbi:MAG: TIGR03915 family putative DNA repair protein [Treponema sp.]|jgi:probable DNA metabolism protein|nr:TIGR03915 family putative DNA repair protein [Treponema sp.]
MGLNLRELLSLLADPSGVREERDDSFFLLDETPARGGGVLPRHAEQADVDIIKGLHSSMGVKQDALPETAKRFYELSVNAFDAFVHAWMSELPLEAQMLKFGRKVVSSADRKEAERAATDRGDADALAVLTASARVRHEIHRMFGLLRFFPGPKDAYTAFCSPDYFVLPALGGHFTARFGKTPWNIIDAKRGLCLSRLPGEQAVMRDYDGVFSGNDDEWVALWRRYHGTINNECRKNLGLQRQFMPKRYWKFLPEM